MGGALLKIGEVFYRNTRLVYTASDMFELFYVRFFIDWRRVVRLTLHSKYNVKNGGNNTLFTTDNGVSILLYG